LGDLVSRVVCRRASSCQGCDSTPRFSSVDMSPRYAHLAPLERHEGVAKLNESRFLALTLRLPWENPPAMWRYPIDFIGGKGGTRTLDPGIMSGCRSIA
jgi:hypothetical protein